MLKSVDSPDKEVIVCAVEWERACGGVASVQKNIKPAQTHRVKLQVSQKPDQAQSHCNHTHPLTPYNPSLLKATAQRVKNRLYMYSFSFNIPVQAQLEEKRFSKYSIQNMKPEINQFVIFF